MTPTGTVFILATGLNHPEGLAVHPAGDLYVSDTGSGQVREVTPAGTVSMLATGFDDPVALAFDAPATSTSPTSATAR